MVLPRTRTSLVWRVDFVVESCQLQYSPPRKERRKMAESKLLIIAARGGFWRDLFTFFTAQAAKSIGNRGRLRGLIRSGGRARNGYEITYFNLSSAIVSSLRHIWFLKYISQLSLSRSRYNGDKGGEEAFSLSDFNSGVNRSRWRS